MGKRVVIMMQEKMGFFKRRKLRKMLKNGGYEVAGEAYQCEYSEYAELLRRTKPDVALVGVDPRPGSVSDKYNYDLLSDLRKAEPSVQMVVYGTNAQLLGWQDFLTWGAASYILLSAEQDALLKELALVLSVPRVEAYRGRGERVLVQQRHADSLKWMSLLLKENGYAVEDLVYDRDDMEMRRERKQYYKPIEGFLEEVDGQIRPKKVVPSLLIADELETLQSFRESYPGVPALMCSKRSTESFVIECIRAGAKDFVGAPFKPERLLHSVNTLCSLGDEPESGDELEDKA